MSTFGKCKGGGRRAAQRSRAPLIAVITTLKESHSALLVDVSATGVRLRGPGLPHSGADLFVTVEGVIAFGTVAWEDRDERGIAFDERLRPGEQQLLQQRVAQAHGLPPEVKAAFEDWTLGVAR